MNRDVTFHGHGRRIASAAITGGFGDTAMSSDTLMGLSKLLLSSVIVALPADALLHCVPRAISPGFIPAKRPYGIISLVDCRPAGGHRLHCLDPDFGTGFAI